MITQLDLYDVPPFGAGPVTLAPLRKVTFIFGPNGSGKTSIGRVLSEPEAFPNCTLAWTPPDQEIAVRAFNRRYIGRIFGSEPDLAGVFVLGDASKEAQQERVELEEEQTKLDAELERLGNTLGVAAASGGGKRGEMFELEAALREDIWKAKNAFPKGLESIFLGYNSNKQRLVDRVLAIRGKVKPVVLNKDDLLARALSLAGASAGQVSPLAALDERVILDCAGDALWAESIVGSADVTLADLIGKLQNSDWVKAGTSYLEHSEGICPFCQHETPADFVTQLAAYFDETFMAKLDALTELASSTFSVVDSITTTLDAAKLGDFALVDRAAFDVADAQLRLLLAEVEEQVRLKQSEPSSNVTLPDLTDGIDVAQQQIAAANAKIKKHNELIATANASRQALEADSWSYFVWSALDTAIAEFELRRAPLQLAITSIDGQIQGQQTKREGIRQRLSELAAAAVSSQPTIDAINTVLLGAGFSSFKLAPSTELTDGYCLVREGGEPASETLSEGERTFITYLYFLHEIKGVDRTVGGVPPLVIVIDDPVSSLDSAALFFVSTTVRELARGVLEDNSNVKQLIVFTHNVYFHKEVTFRVDHWQGASDVTIAYHVIRKMDTPPNRLEHCDQNPVRNTYELLWDDVKTLKAGADLVVGIQNSMRRIIESYFSLTGKKNVNDVPQTFTGETNAVERMICQSLISWLHDGSHATGLFDSLDYSIAGASPTQYLLVFERVFRETGHGDHFDLMMGVVSAVA